MRDLSYVTHSGFGHQYESLMNALFLASASRRTLVVPPLMGHKDNVDIPGVRGCAGVRQVWEYHTKTTILLASNQKLVTRCHHGGDSFFDVFDFRGLPARDGGCGTVNRRTSVAVPCPDTLHDTLTVYGNGSCTEPRPCQIMLHRLNVGTIGNPLVLRRNASSVRDEAARAEDTFCLGPINGYYVKGLLEVCRHEHRQADEYLRFGLPWKPSLLQTLSQLQPPLRPTSCSCLYLRLPDHNSPGVYRTANTSARLLITALQQSGAILSHGTGSGDDVRASSRQYEVVSNCFPMHVCEEYVRAAYGAGVVIEHTERRHRAARTLGMTPGNAELLYDIVRCARCSQIQLVSPPHRNLPNHSSFFTVVQLLHARWHQMPA